MLGVIHRAVLGEGPPQLRQFFRLATTDQRNRADGRRHQRHLVDPQDGRELELLRRSALGLISVYNKLPAGVTDAPTVPTFQRGLQSLVLQAPKNYSTLSKVWSWKTLFSPR